MTAHFLELGDGPPPAPPRPLDFFDLCRLAPPMPLLRRFPLAFCDRWRWLPVHETDPPEVRWLPEQAGTPVIWRAASERTLVVVMESPTDQAALRAIALRSGRTLLAVPVAPAALDRFLAERYPAPAT